MSTRVLKGSIRAQVALSLRSLDDARTLVAYPLFTLVFIAILEFSGRADLASHALVATTLMNVSGMALLVASELVARERNDQTLELVVASPAPFFLILLPRIAMITSLGLIGFVEAWFVVWLVAGVSVTIYHVWLLLLTLVLTILATTGTALITAAFLCFGRSTRTIQNSMVFPLYVLGGVLVPVTFLPDWIEPASRIIFLYWAAELMRDSLTAASPEDVLGRVAALAGLGAVGGAVGAALLTRMLQHLKQEGSLGLT
jgi:ABC-2 type transport system permease protein